MSVFIGGVPRTTLSSTELFYSLESSLLLSIVVVSILSTSLSQKAILGPLAVARLGVTALVVCSLALDQGLGPWPQAMKMLVMLGGLALLWIGPTGESPGVALLILLVILGNLLLIGSANLILVYLALELQTLALFVLVAYNKTSLLSSEAGLKYFVLGALSSGLFLFGCALVYNTTGELEFQFIQGEGDVSPLLSGGLLLIAVSLLFKLSAAPFHMWAPDVYGGAPTWVVALLSIVPKLGILAIIVQIGLDPRALLIAGLMSLIVGAIGALNQTRIKRLLAYSGIGHMGFVLLGVAIGSEESLQATLLYVGAYIITQVLLWAAILVVDSDALGEFSGLSRRNPVLAGALATGLLSAAGIPPLVGFLTKWCIVVAAVGQGYYLSALTAVICSVVAGIYYLRLVKIMYVGPTTTPLILMNALDEAPYPLGEATMMSPYIVMGASLYLVLTIIVCPSLFFQLAYLSVIGLFPGCTC
uniref:NADH dehydrogenase subunit 2 n=1 Tax=Leptophyton benayahui TaxID=767318 RepID=UPI001FAF1AE9|nr:NADH dehydrogenase subunit 2 [Leptophyton benayahui]UKP88401.1 NADH dehydrogenase subunit 2 [Leptophyton benayahui]